MTIGKLIEDILTEIGYVTDGGSVSDAEGKRCLNFVNEAVREMNRQDFLHFTKDLVTLPISEKTEFFLEDAPLKVDKITFPMYGKIYRIRQTMLSSFVNYLDGEFGKYPRAFVYDRIFKDGALVGRIRIDRASSYQMTAVVTNNMTTYTSNSDNISLPPEYFPLIKADVQYRLLMNSGADENLKRSKEFERNKLASSIKESMFVGVNDVDDSVDSLDVIRTGAGRL